MAIVKKPVRKFYFYYLLYLGIVFALVVGLFFKNSNLYQLKKGFLDLFSLISSVKADVPSGGAGGAAGAAGTGY